MSIDGTRYESEVLRAADLFTTNGVVSGAKFVNCLIVGPAIVFFQDGRLDGCGFLGDVDAFLYELPEAHSQIVGALVFVNCSFVDCRFERIGILVPAPRLAEVRASLSGS